VNQDAFIILSSIFPEYGFLLSVHFVSLQLVIAESKISTQKNMDFI